MSAKILFIDDEDVILKSCRKIFKSYDYEIFEAPSGQAGLDIVESQRPDIVVTDLKMPGIGGMEVLTRLRKEHPEIVVIVFTGYATVETAREALKNGAFDYIPKPFSPEEIRGVMENAVKTISGKGGGQMLDLMAIVSHELKSPVSVVHTTAETLHKGYFGNLEPDQQKIIETILRNCEYLEDIIRCYIDLSRMELDNLASFKERIHLVDDVIVPVLEIPEHSKNMKSMEIKLETTGSPLILGDPKLLQIVVTNLLNNAIKYGEAGTSIIINAGVDSDGSGVFSVCNRGVGISKKDIEEKLFQRFARLRQKGTEGVKGSGLGLYICQKIIQKHNGSISVESAEGEWVRFTVKLPAV
jgi:two-component system, sensor histidine kinase and response regulator